MSLHLSIRTKLLGTFLTIAFVMLVATYVNDIAQKRVARYNDAVVHASVRAQALLQMENAAVEIESELAEAFDVFQKGSSQSEGSPAADKKYRLLATLELLNKWRDVYKKNRDAIDQTDIAFVSRIDVLQNNIIDSTLHYIDLQEQGVTALAIEKNSIKTSIDGLKNYIESTVKEDEYKTKTLIQTAGESQSDAVKLNYIVSLFTMLMAIGFGVLFNRHIAQPIVKIRDAALSVARGNFTSMITPETKDEVGDLAQAFSDMLGKLKDSQAGLEAQIEQTQKKSVELETQVLETQKSELAILNLLEDIEEEKAKVEHVVVERTRELREEKSRLLASINSLSFGFIIADKDDMILLQNPAMTKILGLKEEPKSIHDIADFLRGSEKNVESVDPAGSCRECMELKRVVEIKNVLYGTKFLRLFCAPVFDEDKINGYVFLIEDVTEAKVMERSRDEFFAVASHELRTPLTAIRGNAEMILDLFADKVTDPEVKEMLTDIDNSSLRLIDIVNDFLEVSRIEQGKLELKFENFDIQTIIRKVIKDLKAMALKKNITLIYSTENETLPLVRADKNRIEQILINLVGNALKFTDHGGITVSAEIIDNFIKISVTDTGLGISEQNQSRLFRKFQQAGESMIARDVTQGTGLGLYISQLLISNMSGTIGLSESSLGHGSTFVFTVPVML